MKKAQLAAFIFAGMAAAFYLTQQKPAEILTMNESLTLIPIVLKDEQGLLVPLTVESSCTSTQECLGVSLDKMSSSFKSFEKTLPKNISVHSMKCDESCSVDFSRELLEFDPRTKHEVEQVLSYLMKEYEIQELTVEQEKPMDLRINDTGYLNLIHFADHDYHRGYLYQMYMIKDYNSSMVSVPVIVHTNESNPYRAIEEYYSSSASIQFDNVTFRKFEIIEGDPIQLKVSEDCMVNTQLNEDLIFPVLHSLNHVTDSKDVEVYVADVLVKTYQLDNIQINKMPLLD